MGFKSKTRPTLDWTKTRTGGVRPWTTRLRKATSLPASVPTKTSCWSTSSVAVFFWPTVTPTTLSRLTRHLRSHRTRRVRHPPRPAPVQAPWNRFSVAELDLVPTWTGFLRLNWAETLSPCCGVLRFFSTRFPLLLLTGPSTP